MISLKRCKGKWILLVCMFSVFSVWSVVRVYVYSVSRSYAISSEEAVNMILTPCQCKACATEVLNHSIPLSSTNSPSNGQYPSVDFKFAFPDISPSVSTTQNMFMIVLVNSGGKGDHFRKRRESIRQTWGDQNNCEQRKALRNEKLKHLRWLLVFVVGKAGPGTNDDELNMAEARKHNDMLIGNVTDSYLNNVIKLYMGLVWASRYDIKYILKTDDDVYVRIPRVVEDLANARFPKRFYGGMTMKPITVNRGFKRKWPISWEDYDEIQFPRFNSGAFYILSSDLLNEMFNHVYIRKPFYTDDAYVGVVMHDLGVQPTKLLSFFVMANINSFVRSAKDCHVLAKNGFGHHMRPDSNALLYKRLVSLACGNALIHC